MKAPPQIRQAVILVAASKGSLEKGLKKQRPSDSPLPDQQGVWGYLEHIFAVFLSRKSLWGTFVNRTQVTSSVMLLTAS